MRAWCQLPGWSQRCRCAFPVSNLLLAARAAHRSLANPSDIETAASFYSVGWKCASCQSDANVQFPSTNCKRRQSAIPLQTPVQKHQHTAMLQPCGCTIQCCPHPRTLEQRWRNCWGQACPPTKRVRRRTADSVDWKAISFRLPCHDAAAEQKGYDRDNSPSGHKCNSFDLLHGCPLSGLLCVPALRQHTSASTACSYMMAQLQGGPEPHNLRAICTHGPLSNAVTVGMRHCECLSSWHWYVHGAKHTTHDWL